MAKRIGSDTPEFRQRIKERIDAAGDSTALLMSLEYYSEILKRCIKRESRAQPIGGRPKPRDLLTEL